MKTTIKHVGALACLGLLTVLAIPADATPGPQGISYQGISYQGISYQGISYQGISYQGISYQGISYQGISYQGISYQGISYQGISYQGISYQGISYQGISYQGISYQGPALRGVDRLAKLGPTVDFVGLELPSLSAPIGATGAHPVLVPAAGTSVQGFQPDVPSPHFREITLDPSQVQLQLGPTNAGHGSYIFVPGLVNLASDPDGARALVGTFWNGVLTDGIDKGALSLYVAAVDKETDADGSPTYLYSVYYMNPASQQWIAACPSDETGRPRAMAVPIDPRVRTPEARKKIAFACTASGVAAKCARTWGYKPWKPGMAPFYDACLIAARADYCQDEQSHTRDGTLVDLFDTRGDGTPSSNPSAGLAYAPFSVLPMLHEEYQVSSASHVRDVLTASQFMSLPPEEQALVTRLLRSGLQSSRYPDLDPGRSCAAAPYVDRCDPAEPYTCYRADNMTSLAYGDFLSVNSPRHCAHDEDHPGDPLDPLCNACVDRVCQVDPTCCGDPGATFYPRALAWDQRCITLRRQVCRSAPGAGEVGLWPVGRVADAPGAHPAVFQRGAIGSFEGIVTQGGVQIAEGWACDPDFPGASSPLQISVGGALGTAGRDAGPRHRRPAAHPRLARDGRRGVRRRRAPRVPRSRSRRDRRVATCSSTGSTSTRPARRSRSCAAGRRRRPPPRRPWSRARRSGPGGSRRSRRAATGSAASGRASPGPAPPCSCPGT